MPPASKTQPLVSIVITCYNYGHFLREAIESALRQSYQSIELLVVDDGSVDSTGEVARSFGTSVTYHYKTNGGLPGARNFGLARCHGVFVIFLDADDILRSNYVEKLSIIFLTRDDGKLAFVYTQMELFGTVNSTTDFPDFSVAELREGNYIHAAAMLRASVV